MRFFRLLMSLSGIVVAHSSFGDSMRLSKLRPRTVVYLYNGTKSDSLISTFSCESLDGRPVSTVAHYPNIGNKIVVRPLQNDAYKVPEIAELARNRGIESDRVYVFTQTIDLPGLGPILELKQQLVGNSRTFLNPFAFGSTIKAGFAVPSRGIEPLYFNDQAWHQLVIQAATGNWVVSFCFYGTGIWSDLKSALEENEFALKGHKGELGFLKETVIPVVGTVSAVALWGAVGGTIGATIGLSSDVNEAGAKNYEAYKEHARALREKISEINREPRPYTRAIRSEKFLERSDEDFDRLARAAERVESGKQKVRQAVIATGVVVSAAVAAWLSTKITGLCDNLLYTIEFKPYHK